MISKYNVLVTGCGGDIGQSVGKILKSSLMINRVIGCDINDQNPSRFIFDEVHKVSRCDSDDYYFSLQNIITENDITFIIPISEGELRLIEERRIEKYYFERKLIAANLRALQIGFDKLITAKFIEGLKLPAPFTCLLDELGDPKFPLIAKSRRGSGGKSIFLLNDLADFKYCKYKYPDFIAQEFLNNDEEEYTCGLFRSGRGLIRTIIFKRKLIGGFSSFGVVMDDLTIEKLLVTIAEALELRGSINIQLRVVSKGPCVFEINPRFSSTVRFRHMMGFQDLIWSIEDAMGLELSPYSKVPPGKKFYKGYHEYIE